MSDLGRSHQTDVRHRSVCRRATRRQRLCHSERRDALKKKVAKYGLDIVAVDTVKKNKAKRDKSVILFRENKTEILKQNLTTEQYFEKIDVGIYDKGYAVACGVIRRGVYTNYEFIYIDIDKKKGVDLFLDTGDRKGTIEELADRQYIEFNGVDKSERI